MGNEAGGGNRDFHAAVLVLCVLPPAVQNTPRHVRDADNVLIRLGGQAQHIVELDRVPSTGKGNGAGVQQILFRDVFVDRVAQTLTSALYSEGQAAFSHLLHLIHEVKRKIVDTKRRKR